MLKYGILGVLLLCSLPGFAMADRHGGHGEFHGGGHSSVNFSFGLGLGFGGDRYSYYDPYYRPAYYYEPAVVYAPPPVVYSAPPVVYSEPAVVYSAPPVVYERPAVVYPRYDYAPRTYYDSGCAAPAGGYVYSRTTVYYGR